MSTSAAESGYMTTAEVSRERGITPATLRFWRSSNTGPASFKLGRRVFYRRTDVESWFTRQEALTKRGGDAA